MRIQKVVYKKLRFSSFIDFPINIKEAFPFECGSGLPTFGVAGWRSKADQQARGRGHLPLQASQAEKSLLIPF